MYAHNRSTSSSRRRVIPRSPTIQQIESQRIQECCKCCRHEIKKSRKYYIKSIFSNPVLYLLLIFVCYSVYIQNYIQTELDSHSKYSSADKIELVRAVEAPVSTKVAILDSDKIDRCDYALESLGGKILSIGSTKLYVPKANNIIGELFSSILQLACNPSQRASLILKPSVFPGECWAFEGSTGTAVIQLYGPIIVSGVTLEHIPITITPTGELSAAPKEFAILGLMDDNDEGFNFGKFIYDINDTPQQYFEVKQKVLLPFNMVRFEVLSNWGNNKFTCVYRISIHGDLDLRQ
ncbi:sperm-associated antigen 4 [Arctopsyche grandis]|uniref:sperm-associated antigen 4 n=1 Tax=Arctopsyche grandis TaxID=121162 RepID=UPI00406D9848